MNEKNNKGTINKWFVSRLFGFIPYNIHIALDALLSVGILIMGIFAFREGIHLYITRFEIDFGLFSAIVLLSISVIFWITGIFGLYTAFTFPIEIRIEGYHLFVKHFFRLRKIPKERIKSIKFFNRSGEVYPLILIPKKCSRIGLLLYYFPMYVGSRNYSNKHQTEQFIENLRKWIKEGDSDKI